MQIQVLITKWMSEMNSADVVCIVGLGTEIGYVLRPLEIRIPFDFFQQNVNCGAKDRGIREELTQDTHISTSQSKMSASS